MGTVVCRHVQATMFSRQHAVLKLRHPLLCAWHLLSVLSSALCAKKTLSTATAANLSPPHWSVDYKT